MQKHRVVVTGMGVLSPLGVGVEPTWGKLIKGQSGIRKIDRFDVSDYAVQIAGQVPGATEEHGFNAEEFIGKKDMKKMSRFIQYGMKAVDEALNEAKLDLEDEELMRRTGVMLGSGIGGLEDIENATKTLNERGP